MQLPEDATGTVVKKSTETTTTTTTTTRNRITRTDPYLIERIVGYQEYGKALYYFDRLAEMCDEYEMDAIEDIVRSEPEFKFYTVKGASDITTREMKENDLEPSQERHGFRWLSALARVEIGAMKSGFSENPKPFPVSPGYDAEEYRVLLKEGARLHFWSLARDPTFAALAKRFTPSSLTLSYLRRLNIGTGFSIAGGLMSISGSSPQLAANGQMEMSKYTGNLLRARGAIESRIAAYLATVRVNRKSRTSTSSESLTLAELCHEGICKQFDTN